MALVALCAQRLFVRVVCLVAANAICFAVFELMAAMAFLAGGDRMQANERERGYVMIKANLAAPVRFIMALLAIFALLSSVYIINLVAAQAIGLQLVFMYITLVTGVATQFLVFTAQFEVGVTVM